MERNFEQVLELVTDTEQSQEALVDLSVSVDRLYEVFEVYPFRSDVDYCSHCITSEDVAILQSKPLSELLPDDLEKYGFKAMTTWGDIDYFKHYLPRMLEFYPSGGIGWNNPEIIFGKLAYGEWRNWPRVEQDALESYFRALWKVVLFSVEPTLWTYSADFLCAIAQAVDDLSEFLILWQQTDDPIAIRNLVAFIGQNTDHENRLDKRSRGFWETRDEQWNQVICWLETCKLYQEIVAS